MTPAGSLRFVLAAALAAAACGRPAPETAASREAREAMLFTIASQFRESAASIGVIEFEPVEFRDGCLEVERTATCARARTPGYRLRVRRQGGLYEYRAPSASPTDVVLASGPDPHIGAPALEWRWPAGPGGCRTLLVSADARPAVGWCDGPVAEVEWLTELFQLQEWEYFRGRFAPFTLTHDGHTLAFQGRGVDAGSEPWRHALERWAALRWSDLNAGRSGAAHGRGLAYRKPRRGASGTATCDVLEVTEYGVAYAGASLCEGGGGEPGKTAWLSDPLWNEMGVWLEEWAPYTDEAAGLYFFGRGTHVPDAEEARRLIAWCERALVHVAASATEAWQTSDPRTRTR